MVGKAAIGDGEGELRRDGHDAFDDSAGIDLPARLHIGRREVGMGGRAYLAATDPAAAIAPLEEARRRTAEISRAVLDLARAYEALGRRAEALQAYRDYLSNTAGEGETAGRQQAAAGLKRTGVAPP